MRARTARPGAASARRARETEPGSGSLPLYFLQIVRANPRVMLLVLEGGSHEIASHSFSRARRATDEQPRRRRYPGLDRVRPHADAAADGDAHRGKSISGSGDG